MDLAPRLGHPSTGVIVTGGASGLGRASAEALAAVGRPIAIWDLDADRCRKVADELRGQYGGVAFGCAVDVRNPARIEAAAAETRRALPSIGGFVHAAGIVDTDSLDGLTPGVYSFVFDAKGYNSAIRYNVEIKRGFSNRNRGLAVFLN